jgi:hypothetical protein
MGVTELPSGVHTSSRLARVRVWVSITSGQGGVGGGIRGGAVRHGGWWWLRSRSSW